MNLKDNRLVQAFTDLRAAGKKTVLPFITAGYPDLATTLALLQEFERRGAKICELGVPFSDPIADGPVIQASYTDALACGITSEKILDMVRQYRQAGGKLALLAMVSYSIVFRAGSDKYLAAAGRAGFDGFIIPDLPLDEATGVKSVASALGLANVMLIAPTTPPKRRLEIARHSRGFIYFISIAGITGERTVLPATTRAAVAKLREHTQTPVCVGFGVSNAAMVAEVCKVADGAIVGSAIVHRITDGLKQNLDHAALVARLGRFVGQLLEPVQ